MTVWKLTYNILSINLITFLDMGFVKDANVSSTFPSLLIKILWKFHFGTADLPWLSFAHLKSSWAFSPLTSVIAVSGKFILKFTSQNSFTSGLFFKVYWRRLS